VGEGFTIWIAADAVPKTLLPREGFAGLDRGAIEDVLHTVKKVSGSEAASTGVCPSGSAALRRGPVQYSA